MVDVSRVGQQKQAGQGCPGIPGAQEYTAGQEVEATSEKGEPKGNTGVGVGTWEKDRKELEGR